MPQIRLQETCPPLEDYSEKEIACLLVRAKV